eukprot:14786404-Alexandrium_andersonii.AAC.1
MESSQAWASGMEPPSMAARPILNKASFADRAPNWRRTSQSAGRQTSKCSEPNSSMPQRGQGS